MTSSLRKVACMFRIKFPTKRIFRIFPILRTDGMAPLGTYLWNDPRIRTSDRQTDRWQTCDISTSSRTAICFKSCVSAATFLTLSWKRNVSGSQPRCILSQYSNSSYRNTHNTLVTLLHLSVPKSKSGTTLNLWYRHIRQTGRQAGSCYRNTHNI